MPTVREGLGCGPVVASKLSILILQPPLRDEVKGLVPVPWSMAGCEVMHAYGRLCKVDWSMHGHYDANRQKKTYSSWYPLAINFLSSLWNPTRQS